MQREDLSQYLKAHKIRKYQFAKDLGISRTSIMRYLSGNRPFPKATKLAIAFLTKGKIILDDKA